MTTMAFQTTLEAEECGECGGVYALSAEFIRQCRNVGKKKSWNCPYCRTIWRFTESDVDKLQKKLDSEISRHDQTRAAFHNQRNQKNAAKRSARAFKGQVTKIKNRIADGICPCCKRTFVDLQRHMRSQHPHWEEEIEEKPVE